jgi:hypothetical protein
MERFNFARVERVALVALLVSLLIWSPSIFQHMTAMYQKNKFDFANYMSVDRVSVGNGVEGETVILDVKRTVYKPFRAHYFVTVETFPERSIVCTADDVVDYFPGRNLPDDLTLSWWADDGECSGAKLPAGDYILTTRWQMVNIPDSAEPQIISVESLPFRIAAVATDQAKEAIEDQREIREKLNSITRSLRALERRVD